MMRIRTKPRCASYTRKPISARSRNCEAPGWLTYDIPREILTGTWKGKYRGQKQKWYALRFTGEESEINVRQPGGGHHKAEFLDWRWVQMKELPALVVPFKQQIYEQVVKEFAKFAAKL